MKEIIVHKLVKQYLFLLFARIYFISCHTNNVFADLVKSLLNLTIFFLDEIFLLVSWAALKKAWKLWQSSLREPWHLRSQRRKAWSQQSWHSPAPCRPRGETEPSGCQAVQFSQHSLGSWWWTLHRTPSGQSPRLQSGSDQAKGIKKLYVVWMFCSQ